MSELGHGGRLLEKLHSILGSAPMTKSLECNLNLKVFCSPIAPLYTPEVTGS